MADERNNRRRTRRRRRRRASPLPAILLALALAAGGIVIWKYAERPKEPQAEGIAVPEYVTVDLIPENPWSRPGIPLESVTGVVVHYVGNPGTSARANRNYFASLASGAEQTYASSHFVVGLEGEVVQCIPLTEEAYATKERNVDTVAIEVCHPDESGQFSAVTYDRLVELTAWLCREFQLNPETDVIRHYDVTGKLCPLYYVEHPEAWETFLADVAQAPAEE